MGPQNTRARLWSSVFQILLYLASELVVVHQTGVWAGGRLRNMEPASQIPDPHNSWDDISGIYFPDISWAASLAEQWKTQASKHLLRYGLSSGREWSVLNQLFQNRTAGYSNVFDHFNTRSLCCDLKFPTNFTLKQPTLMQELHYFHEATAEEFLGRT